MSVTEEALLHGEQALQEHRIHTSVPLNKAQVPSHQTIARA
jgi:hypothetical protein